MSGTSADGIDVALIRISETKSSRDLDLKFDLLGHEYFAYTAKVRAAVLKAMNATSSSVAELSRLNFLLGELYADAVRKAQRKIGARSLGLVGCHGQTIYHQGEARTFLGKKISCTWQTGEGAVIAARLGIPVVSDFRPADMAAGGKGAPLVPFLDYFLYRDQRVARIAQNIGGIANLTAIPAGASLRQVIAFDTGPGNMVMDAVMEELFGKRYDRDGKVAASGRVLDGVVEQLVRAPFFRQKPPRTAGREEFGREYVGRFLQICRGAGKADVVATATALTARSIADAVHRFVLPRFVVPRTAARRKPAGRQMIVSGGGAKNPTLMAMLRDAITPLGIELHFSDEFGLPAQAKEAVAFALLAHETWHRRPSNVPSATGAKRAAILGKISYA